MQFFEAIVLNVLSLSFGDNEMIRSDNYKNEIAIMMINRLPQKSDVKFFMQLHILFMCQLIIVKEAFSFSVH